MPGSLDLRHLTMNFISENLVSDQYCALLRRDMARASICRFMVAYTSNEGLHAIGWWALLKALRNPHSFGVASLSCSCGHEPLLRLQGSLGQDLESLRCKYFMDPVVKDGEEPSKVSLFHSKLVFLKVDGFSVIYIGSHNWTRRALGPSGTRNAEASMRLEFEFSEDHLLGLGDSLPSQVNRHLLAAWNCPLCLPSVESRRKTFAEWREAGCRNKSSGSLDEAVVILAVSDQGTSVPPQVWINLKGSGIYLQTFNEEEGNVLWDVSEHIIILVWDSDTSLLKAQQPTLVRCRKSSQTAGQSSDRRGTNASSDPIEGFKAILWDMAIIVADDPGAVRARKTKAQTGREVSVFDFSYPTPLSSASQVAGSRQAKYQFYFEVEQVVLPANVGVFTGADFVWWPHDFAVAGSKRTVHTEQLEGFQVSPEDAEEMRNWLAVTLGVDLRCARVLPCVGDARERSGKRFSRHPLHETFINLEETHDLSKFYEKSAPGALVAELVEAEEGVMPALTNKLVQPIPRLSRLFTAPWRELKQLWTRHIEH